MCSPYVYNMCKFNIYMYTHYMYIMCICIIYTHTYRCAHCTLPHDDLPTKDEDEKQKWREEDEKGKWKEEDEKEKLKGGGGGVFPQR